MAEVYEQHLLWLKVEMEAALRRMQTAANEYTKFTHEYEDVLRRGR